MAQKLGKPIAAISKVLKGIISVAFAVFPTSSGKTEEQTAVFWKRQMPQVLSPILSRTNFVVRMPLSRLPKKIVYGELTNGRRNQGRQRKRFKDSLKHNLKQCGINHVNWEQLANDRPSWRSAIHTGVAHSEQQRKEHSERLRLARKERQRDDSAVPISTEFRCPVCQRICSSRTGLYSHR